MECSPNVFVNGRGCVRVGDMYETHCCDDDCHTGRRASQGNPTVFVNGRMIHRIGDGISCGDTAGQGSSNVFA